MRAAKDGRDGDAFGSHARLQAGTGAEAEPAGTGAKAEPSLAEKGRRSEGEAEGRQESISEAR